MAATLSPASPPAEHRTAPRGAWLAFGLAASCYVLAMFHRMTLGVAALDAEHRFSLGAGGIAALSVVGLAAYLVGQLPAGVLADRIGPRRALLVGLGLMAVGEGLFAVAHVVGLALVGRTLIGLGDACIFLNVLRVAAHWFPRAQFAPLTSIAAVLGAAGQLVSTVPLNAALAGPGWSATFATGALATLALALLIAVALRERPPGQLAPPRAAHPPLRVTLRTAWARPATREGFWLHLSSMAPFVVVTGLWGAPLLVDAQGFTRAQASLALLVAVAAVAVSAPLIGLAARRRPERRQRLGLRAATAVVIALAVLIVVPAGAIPAPVTLLCLCVLGVGCGTAMLAFDLARQTDDGHDGASTSALVNLGGFSAAIAGDALVPVLRDVVGAGSDVALAPVLVIALLGLWRFRRLARA